MSVRLVIVEGPTRDRTIQLRRDVTIIGRGKGSDLRIPSALISRRHCLLSFQDGYLTVEDLSSFNGTFLNDKPVAGKQLVRPNDQLRIGPVTFSADYKLTRAAAEKFFAGQPSMEAIPTNATTSAEDGLEIIEELEPVELELEPVEPDDGPIPVDVSLDDEGEVILELDEAESWKLPEGKDLRNILGELEE